MLAIALLLNDSPKLFINNIWEILKNEYDVDFIYSRSELPHLTLISSIEDNNQNFLVNYLNKKIHLINSFELITNGIGIFVLNTPLVYMRWWKNIYLEEIRNSLYEEIINMDLIKNYDVTNINWIPKTSICYRDIKLNEDLLKILRLIKALYKNDMTFNVGSLGIIKYNDEGEKLIEEIKFINKYQY